MDNIYIFNAQFTIENDKKIRMFERNGILCFLKCQIKQYVIVQQTDKEDLFITFQEINNILRTSMILQFTQILLNMTQQIAFDNKKEKIEAQQLYSLIEEFNGEDKKWFIFARNQNMIVCYKGSQIRIHKQISQFQKLGGHIIIREQYTDFDMIRKFMKERLNVKYLTHFEYEFSDMQFINEYLDFKQKYQIQE